MKASSIESHMKRMGATKSIGDSYEWSDFKKEIRLLSKQLESSNKERNRLRSLVKSKSSTIRIIKNKLR